MRPGWWLLACLALGLPLQGHGADVAVTRLQVSALVRAHARLDSHESAPVTITAADVARGYVEVTRGYALRTNAPERVVLRFQRRVGYARAIDIDGLGPTHRLPDTGLEVAAVGSRELNLSFRLWLVEGLTPGDHPLPLHVAAVVQ